jgi:hypothetical protein
MAGKAGRLAAAKPGATTNTTLYTCPVGRSASVVLYTSNQSGTATSYRVALRDYNQIITTTSSAHKFNIGNPISSYRLRITPGIKLTAFSPGDTYTSDNKSWNLKILDVFKDTSILTVPTKVSNVGTLSYGTLTGGTFAVGNTITDSTNALTATVLDVNTVSSQLSLDLPALSTSATTIRFASLPSNLATNKYLAISKTVNTVNVFEIVRVSAYTTGQYSATIVRAQQGSAAMVIPPGATSLILNITATTTTVNEGALLTLTDASITVASTTGLFIGDYIKIDNEFMSVTNVDAGTSTLNVGRAALGSTAATHTDGSTVTRVTNDGSLNVNYFCNTPAPAPAALSYAVTEGAGAYSFSGSATGNDPTLTVNIGDTLTFAVTTPSNPFYIVNAAAPYSAGNQVSGVTGQGSVSGNVVWNTTGVAAGTYYYISSNSDLYYGQIIVQTAPTTPTITSGSVSARVTTNAVAFSSQSEFVYDLTNTGVYKWSSTSLELNSGRSYRFTQTDTSNTAHPLRFSDSMSGSPLYTSGVTTTGTPGSAGSYTQIDLSGSSLTTIYTLSTTTGEVSYGSQFSINSDPNYTEIFVYEVSALPNALDTFTSGKTTSVTQTISYVSPAPFGYVQDFTGTSLKVSLPSTSSSFATVSTAITGSNGANTLTVASATGLALGMAVSGTNVGTNAVITDISGLTITVSVANSSAVSTTGTFNHRFYDTPLIAAGTRSFAQGSSYADINVADYILYDKAITANALDKTTSIVVGPGQSLMVYSTLATVAYTVNGFEDSTTDWTTVHYVTTTGTVTP